MSEYLRRLARRGAGAPGPEAVPSPETIPAFAFGDTRTALDEAGAEPGGDHDASTSPSSPEGERAVGGAAGMLAPSAPPSRSAASESMAEVTETSPVPSSQLYPYEGVVEATSRPAAFGESRSSPKAGAALVSTTAAQSGRDPDAGRASDVAPQLSTLSAPSHPVDRAGPAMPLARGRSGPNPSGSPAADLPAIRAEIGSEGPGREGQLDRDAEAPDPPHFATEPHVETEPRDAPRASPKGPDPSVALTPASAAVVATPPAAAPVPQTPPVHRTGPEVSVSIGRITVQSEAPHPTATEPPRSARPSRFSSMTLARRHVDRRWY